MLLETVNITSLTDEAIVVELVKVLEEGHQMRRAQYFAFIAVPKGCWEDCSKVELVVFSPLASFRNKDCETMIVVITRESEGETGKENLKFFLESSRIFLFLYSVPYIVYLYVYSLFNAHPFFWSIIPFNRLYTLARFA